MKGAPRLLRGNLTGLERFRYSKNIHTFKPPNQWLFYLNLIIMKRILLILIFIVSCTLCKAQRVTYNDLRYVLSHNLGQIEEYLSQKGFNYAGADTASEEKKIYSSKFVKKYKDYINEITVSKGTIDGEPLDASFDTYLKSDYLAFKNYIKKIGYVMLNSSTTENGSLLLQYNKGKSTVAFSIATVGSSKNLYIISLLEIIGK